MKEIPNGTTGFFLKLGTICGAITAAIVLGGIIVGWIQRPVVEEARIRYSSDSLQFVMMSKINKNVNLLADALEEPPSSKERIRLLRKVRQ